MDIYYALWAQLAEFPVFVRAFLVVGIFFLLFGIFFEIAGFRILGLGIQMIIWIIKLFFVLLSSLLHIRINTKGMEVWNGFCNGTEAFCNMLLRWKQRLPKARGRLWNVLGALYLITVAAIVFPPLLNHFVNEKYQSRIAVVRNLYLDLEKGPLQEAAAYEPPLKISVPEEPEAASEAQTEEEKCLRLSERGVAGANVRTEPDKASDSIAILSGDVRMTYMDEQDGWIYVRLEDGTLGWIRDYLVEEISGEEGKLDG